MARTGRENLCRRPDVIACERNLRQSHGEEHRPRTATTRRMLRHMLGEGVQEQFSSDAVRRRARLFLGLETLMGLRVGEALSGGDYHGLLANNLVILRNIQTGVESVEATLEHSKTGFKRIINAVAESEGAARVELARIVREYWQEAGFTLVSRYEGNYVVTGPDYYVVRVGLSAMGAVASEDDARFDQLCRVLRCSESERARAWADYTQLRGGQRMRATGSNDKRYINVIGGQREDPELQQVALELELAGFGGRTSLVPGPLVRATHGRLGLSCMPLNPQTTYDSLHGLFDEAFRRANLTSPDPELDLQGYAEPLWGHHSNRRLGDTVARETMAQTGATERDIDIIFGWQEAFYNSKMQTHYESTFTREVRTRVTRML